MVDKSEKAHKTLKSQMFIYQRAVKNARSAHFSEVILNPKVLFKLTDSVMSGPPTSFPEPDAELSKEFLAHFMKKVKNVRSQIHPDPCSLSILHASLIPIITH